MTDEFRYDVFLSYSRRDRERVREIAERLRADGLRVWPGVFEEEGERLHGVSGGAATAALREDGLEQSRVLVLCLSAQAYGDEWAQLEAETFRFRDPLHQARRFLLLRLDAAPVKESLAQIPYINMLSEVREHDYATLIEACRLQKKIEARMIDCRKTIALNHSSAVYQVAFSQDDLYALSASMDKTVRLWDLATGNCLRIFQGHTNSVNCVAWSPGSRFFLSGSEDDTVRLWETTSGQCLQVLEGHQFGVNCIEWSKDSRFALSGSDDKTIRLWDLDDGRCLFVFKGHNGQIHSVAWSNDNRFLLSGSEDCTMRLWDIESRRCLQVFEGHSSGIKVVKLSHDGRFAFTGSKDKTMRYWDVKRGHCLRVFEGHTARSMT